MIPYRRLLVGLTPEVPPAHTLRYAAFVRHLVGAEEVHVVHAIDSPMLLGDDPWDLREEILEVAREEVGAALRETFGAAGGMPPGTVTFVEEAPLPALLRRALDVDLVVVGVPAARRPLAERLARKAPCSVLAVPPSAPAALRRILVPVDLSEGAEWALTLGAVEAAATLARAAGLDRLDLLYARGLPLGRSEALAAARTGGSSHDRAERVFARLADEADVGGLALFPHVKTNSFPDLAIRAFVEEQEVDLVVMGSHAKSLGAAVLLGSTAEETLREADVPVLVVRPKGETVSVLDALLRFRPVAVPVGGVRRHVPEARPSASP